MIVPIALGDDVFIKRARFLDDAISNNDLIMHLKLTSEKEVDDLKVIVSIPELGIKEVNGPFDLEDDYYVLMYIPLNDAKPGMYVAKLTVFNNEVREVKYRWFFVV